MLGSVGKVLTSRFGMTLLVANRMADGQIGLVAIAAFAQRLNVFQCCINHVDVLTTHPARHLAVQLASYRVVNFLAGVGWFAHIKGSGASVRPSGLPVCPASCPP